MDDEDVRGVVQGTGIAVRSARHAYLRLRGLRDDAEAVLSRLDEQLADAEAALREAQHLHTLAVIEQTRTILERSEETLRHATRAIHHVVGEP